MSKMRKLWLGLAVVLLALAAMSGVAQARQPFLPGQAKSQALAMRLAHPPCAWVGVAPLTAEEASGPSDLQPGATALGMAWPGQCRIAVDASTLRFLYGRGREQEMMVCTIIAHEYMHLSGAPDDTGNDLMNADWSFGHSYPPCRRLFPSR